MADIKMADIKMADIKLADIKMADIHVSVITPTYQRRKFIPLLIDIYKNQTYPKQNMEWIILDDGKDSVADLFEEAARHLPNIRYIRSEDRVRIGAKRNRLNDLARGPVIVAMDDDDYYPPQRVESVMKAFKKYPRVDLAGSSEMFLYYHDTKTIMVSGPYHPNHATNGTMAWRKRYSNAHRYDDYVTHAEEVSFLCDYRFPMIQLDPLSTILVICHSENTVDKFQMRKEHETASAQEIPIKMRVTKHQLKDIVPSARHRQFYLELS